MSSITFDIKESLATITFNRPEKLNAFDREMALEFQAKLDFCANSADVKVVIITGNGKAFSAGQDLAAVAGSDQPGIGRILSELYNPIVTKITSMPKPVVAAVNGVAAGAGANIALCCDIVVAASSAVFIQAFSKIGLIPDSGGTWFLPRLIGWQRASALMLLGDKVSAAEAADMGMIFKTYPDPEFAASVEKIGSTLISMPAAGLALTKRALQLSMNKNLHDQLIEEDELQQQAAGTPAFRESVAQFLKRKP